ncbi:DinB family protein [Jeotgalibacillus aurantiacus]|uniref:DinB family protein n=1 Tax=Jeotgalibacillus aurantiacus TaxID=2763266 RepID=UPI001D0A8F45|nr:DinB family protein [Jeotgalibacillus aurantiacus]
MITIEDWFSYHKWGTQKQLDHLKTLPEEIYTREIQSVFPSIKEVFDHVYVVDYLWLERIKGVERPEAPATSLRTVEEASAAFKELHQQYDQLLTKIDPVTVHSFVTMKGIPMTNTIEEMVYTVVNHGSYHRGNVTAMHRQLGYSGVVYDYIYYLNEKRS